MIKRILCLGVVLVMCLGFFSACSGGRKIDIGGEIVKGKIPATCQVRVMLDGDIFKLENEIAFSVGFGLLPGSNNSGYESQGAFIVLTIDAQGFTITNMENSENNLYEKEFKEYSDNKFICTLDNDRYIPNYYETFEFKLSDLASPYGTIQISAILHYGEGHSGKFERIYYSINSEIIAFSSISMEDAQKKLK